MNSIKIKIKNSCEAPTNWIFTLICTTHRNSSWFLEIRVLFLYMHAQLCRLSSVFFSAFIHWCIARFSLIFFLLQLFCLFILHRTWCVIATFPVFYVAVYEFLLCKVGELFQNSVWLSSEKKLQFEKIRKSSLNFAQIFPMKSVCKSSPWFLPSQRGTSEHFLFNAIDEGGIFA